MCRQSQRFGQCDQLAHRHLSAGKLKTFGIFRQPAHLYGAFPRADEDHVSVRKLNLGHFATKQEIIEIELGANGAAALYLNVEEGAPIRIDAAGLINIVQDTVHAGAGVGPRPRSEEHTSELQSLMRISYAVFCLKKKKNNDDGTILLIREY